MPPIFTVTLNPGLDRTLTVDTLRENSVLRAQSSRLDWGGKGFNVARALHALGISSTALGFVGGFTGQMLVQGLTDLGIAGDFVTVQGETRTNTVFEEAACEAGGSGRYFKVNEAGPPVRDADLAALHARVAAHLTPGSRWALCGSLPPGAPHDTYARLIRQIHAGGGIVYLDAAGDALRAGLTAAPDWVKPNAEEAAELSGTPVDNLAQAQRAAQALRDGGAQAVALSLGAAGLLLVSAQSACHAQPPRITPQTVVGVGDALLAGLLDAHRQQLGPQTSARWAVACGTAAAMTPGVGVGSLAQVQQVAAQVHVTSL
jgi:1-phosphofructokinase family hexose kinase